METKMITLSDKTWGELAKGRSAEEIKAFQDFLNAGLQRNSDGTIVRNDFISVKGAQGHGKVVELCPFGHGADAARIYTYMDPADPTRLVFSDYQAHKPEQKGQTEAIQKAYDAYQQARAEYRQKMKEIQGREKFEPVSGEDLRKEQQRQEQQQMTRQRQLFQQSEGYLTQMREDMKVALSDPEFRDVVWDEMGLKEHATDALETYREALEYRPDGETATDAKLREVMRESIQAELDHRSNPNSAVDPKTRFYEKMEEARIQQSAPEASIRRPAVEQGAAPQETEVKKAPAEQAQTKAQPVENKTSSAGQARDRLHRQVDHMVSTPSAPEATSSKPAMDRLQRQMATMVPEQSAGQPGAPKKMDTAQTVDIGATRSGAQQVVRTAGGLVAHAVAGMAGNAVGGVLKDRGPVAESNGGALLAQYGNELTMAKQKAFANLGAAGMVVAAGGIALTATGKSVAKVVGKKAAMMGAKAVPVVGTVIGLGMAGTRAWNGDWVGAGLEVLGAGVDYIPFVGQALSLSIDTALAARDVMMKDGVCAFGAVDKAGNPVMIKDENGQDVQAVGAEITYKNDAKEGMAKWYGFDSQGKPYLALVGEFKKDKPSGEWTRFDEKGNPIGVMHFDEGNAVGSILMTDGHGGLVAQGNLTSGKYTEYHVDENGKSTGVVQYEGQMKQGMPVGDWSCFYKNGDVRAHINMDTKEYEIYHPRSAEEQPGAAPRLQKKGSWYQDLKIEGELKYMIMGPQIFKAPKKSEQEQIFSYANSRSDLGTQAYDMGVQQNLNANVTGSLPASYMARKQKQLDDAVAEMGPRFTDVAPRIGEMTDRMRTVERPDPPSQTSTSSPTLTAADIARQKGLGQKQ